MRWSPTLATFAILLFASAPAHAQDWPYPAGRTSQSLEGLTVELDLPRELSSDKPASLVVILHGAGGSATGMAGALHGWAAQGYVVCAPKSTADTWSAPDVKAVLRIAAQLKSELPIDPNRVHVVGFSNGGFNLGPLAFDDDLHPRSATWVGSGCSGGSIPKWAKTDLGVLAMAGAQDRLAGSARATPKVLSGKVRSVEVRLQAGLGHKWPRELTPYFQWWMGTMEGRFVPGEDMNFEWGNSIEAAVKALEDAKRGGILVYAFHADDAENPIAKKLQGEVLMDPLVRHYGSQLQAVKLDFAEHREALEALGVKTTPAIVVLKKSGTPKKVVAGKSLKARKIASALKSVAPNKKPPEK